MILRALRLLPGVTLVLVVTIAGGCRGPSSGGAYPGSGPGGRGEDAAQVGSEEPTSEPGKYGGKITSSTITDPKTLNAWVAQENSSTTVLAPLFDGLNERNSYTLRFEPRLADLPAISPDGLTYTYRLRDGVTWSDGQPVTADDVVFTLGVYYDPKIETLAREGLLIDVPQPDGSFQREPFNYRKVDDRTVEFSLPVKFAPAESVFAFPIAPKHKLEAAYRAGRFNQTWGVNTPVRELVASGPWLLAEYVPGQRVVYRRNPRSPVRGDDGKTLPYLEQWTMLIVPDLITMTLKFRGGETDILNPLQPPDYPSVKRDEAKGNYQVLNHGPGWGFGYLCFNMNPKAPPSVGRHLITLFQDARFRRATSHAINRERMVEDLYLGLAKPMWGPISPANRQFFNPNLTQYAFDLEKAKTLLTEIPGLRDTDGDGMLDFQGKEVRFNILTNTENDLRKQMATIISDDLRKIGLNAQFTPVTFNSLVTRLDSSYDWEASVLGFTGGPEPHMGSNIWRSSGPSHQWWPKQKKPATEWEAEIDRLWIQGSQELDPAKRKAVYDRWQVIVAEQQPFQFTVNSEALSAVRNGYGNVKPSSLSLLWNLEEWFDRKATRDRP